VPILFFLGCWAGVGGPPLTIVLEAVSFGSLCFDCFNALETNNLSLADNFSLGIVAIDEDVNTVDVSSWSTTETLSFFTASLVLSASEERRRLIDPSLSGSM